MGSVAVISMHTSPLAQPGTGDSGGMNVYVRELSASLAQAGVDVKVYVRTLGRGPAGAGGGRARGRGGPHPGRSGGPAQGGPAVGRRRVRRRRGRGPRRHRRRRAPRQLLAVRRGRPPPQAPSRPAAGVHLPHPGPGQGRDGRRGTTGPGPRRGRGHRVLRRDLRLQPGGGGPAGRVLRAPRDRIEMVPPGVDHAFFSPGDRAGARTALGPRRPPDPAVRRAHPAPEGPDRRGERPGAPGRPDRPPGGGRRAERRRGPRGVGPGAGPGGPPGPAGTG